ncbi:MAG: LysM peptidoglycan-binding domain-containing protein [Phycisphaeraceae bacterium]
MNKAWIALSFAAIAMVGCKSSETEPVSQVPPPNYASDPEPLAPITIYQGSPSLGDPNFNQPNGGTLSGPGTFQPEPLPPAQPVSRTYTIRKGDTFWSIAQREYGNGQKWRDISSANPSVDPKKLAVGQQITLP